MKSLHERIEQRQSEADEEAWKRRHKLADADEEDIRRTETHDALEITYFGRKIETPEQLLAHAGIDTELWEVVRIVVNNWGVGGKIKRGQTESGRWRPEKLWQQQLRQVKIELRRKAPKFVQNAVRELMKGWKPALVPAKREKRRGDPCMLELALHDAHFGKRCWAAQTGDDFDLAIIDRDYRKALDDLFERARPYSVDKVLIPIGSDFFHVNNWVGTTAKGTVVDSVDDRFTKVFKAGHRAMEYGIRLFKQIADVELFYLGGNHDRETAWYLTQVLAATFEGDKQVKICDQPIDRKYFSYGVSIIGFTHGDEISHDQLPLLMATEAAEQWGKAKFREIHCGHLHKKMEKRYLAGDTKNGVGVRVLPSLSGTDAWHYRKGFTGTVRAAEAYLWSREHGYAGHISVNVP